MEISRNKKALLQTAESVGEKLFTWCLMVSVLLVWEENNRGIWVVLMPLGIAGLAVSFWVKGKLGQG